ncbi:MAG: LamG domain-containing protein, partial [Planctomycetes bacterium]|nr:LamG domain-containing protein [Planctomycetota bacterium]
GDTATTNTAFDPPATGTVAFWMQSSGTPVVRQRIFGVNGNWEARLETTGKISFDLGASPYVGNEPFATDVVDGQDRWYHIVAAFNESDDSYAVYVDGELQASGTSPVNLVTQSPGILTFGTRTGSGENWEGSLRDFRIYDRWLTKDEISDLSGLAGYWKLDETSGTLAVDSSPNGNDGTYTGGVLLNQSGQVDQAADFDGTDGYVSVADDTSLQMDAVFSVSAWIRADESTNVNQMILNKEGEYEIAIFPGGEIRWAVMNTDPGWAWHATGHVITVGKWTHVAMTYDNGTVNTYANGMLVDTYNGSGVVGDQYPSLNELRIGGRSNNPPGKYFDGLIDDVRVFSRVMCPEEVFGQYKGGRPAGIRILQWVEVR